MGPSHTAGQPWFSSFVGSYLLGIFWVCGLCKILVHKDLKLSFGLVINVYVKF
jgi:hypothetical protein